LSLEDDLFDMDETVDAPERMVTKRAAFGWPGGKSKSLKQILPELPYRKKFIDHFCGSGAITINRNPSVLDVMNDRYGGVVCFYRCVRNNVKRLLERLNMNIHSREEFYHAKETWCNETDELERAAKWYYMISRSVICKGACFARATNGRAPILQSDLNDILQTIHYRLKNVQIENLDFEVCFNDYDCSSAVHYLDPPYLGTDPGLYNGSWGVSDLKRLLKLVERSKGFCALSHYPNEIIDACPFWTKKIRWGVKATSEVMAFTKENNKTGREHLNDVDTVVECLYIKG